MMINRAALATAALLLLSSAAEAQDRFTALIANAPESSVRNGYVVNHRREAVQKELAVRPPTREELGVRLPAGATLQLQRTALQIVQYDGVFRIYQYRVPMSRDSLVAFFEAQGLRYDASQQWIFFPGATREKGDFIDDLHHASGNGLRIWRRVGK